MMMRPQLKLGFQNNECQDVLFCARHSRRHASCIAMTGAACLGKLARTRPMNFKRRSKDLPRTYEQVRARTWSTART
eukprot:5439279-Amphidinium_carterae.1